MHPFPVQVDNLLPIRFHAYDIIQTAYIIIFTSCFVLIDQLFNNYQVLYKIIII